LTSTPASLTWNALNLPISVNSTTATYDALGRMVEKGSGGTYTQFVFSPSGSLLAEYSGGLVKGTIPLPGGGTAIYNGGGLNYIRHTDWLGSSRLATTWGHAVYSKEAYAPFGETYYEAGTPDRSFTGQDQDVVTGSGGTGVYDYLFRKYDPSAGRWLSPDPKGWGAVNLHNPQSFDRYAYVENDPLRLVDPSGLDLCYYGDPADVSTDNDPSDWGDSSAAECKAEGGLIVDAQTTVVVDDGDCRGNDPNSVACMQVYFYFNSLGLLSAPNNGRNCSSGSASAGQYVAASAQVAAMTAQFFSGAGPTNQTFGPGTATSAVMGQSAGVQDVLNNYYMTGQTSGLYTFGAVGAVSAGGNPVAQFVGSFRWSMSGGVLSLTNTTSFRSLTYDAGPQWQRSSFGPGGNTHQTYQIGVTCH
jgi:RHS repeat-associated protein